MGVADPRIESITSFSPLLDMRAARAYAGHFVPSGSFFCVVVTVQDGPLIVMDDTRQVPTHEVGVHTYKCMYVCMYVYMYLHQSFFFL